MINIQKKYLKYKSKYLILKNNKNNKNLYGGLYSKCSSNPYFTQIFSLFNIFNKKPNPPEWNVDNKLLFSPEPLYCNVSRTNSIISNLFGLMCNLQCDLTKLTIFKDCVNVIIIDWSNIIHIINNFIYFDPKSVKIKDIKQCNNIICKEIKEIIITIFNEFIIKHLEKNYIIFIIYKPNTIYKEINQQKYYNTYDIIDFLKIIDNNIIKKYLEKTLFILKTDYFPIKTLITEPQLDSISISSSMDDVLFWLITISIFNLLYINGKTPILLTNDKQKIYDNNKTILDNIFFQENNYSITHLTFDNVENFNLIYNQCDNIYLRGIIYNILFKQHNKCLELNRQILNSNTDIFDINNFINSPLLSNITFINTKDKKSKTLKEYINNNYIQKNNKFLINISNDDICPSILYIIYVKIIQKIVFKDMLSLSQKQIYTYLISEELIDNRDSFYINSIITEYDKLKIITPIKKLPNNDINIIECNTKFSELTNLPNLTTSENLIRNDYNIITFMFQKIILESLLLINYNEINITFNKKNITQQDIETLQILQPNKASLIQYLGKLMQPNPRVLQQIQPNIQKI